MTITLRNDILRAGLLLTMLLFVAFIVTLGLLYMNSSTYGRLLAALSGSGYYQPAISLAESLFLLLFSIASGILLQSFFRKTISTEMFYFIFFVISLSLEAFRAGRSTQRCGKLPSARAQP